MKWLALFLLMGVALAAIGQTTNEVPLPLLGVGIDEKVGQQVDPNLEFTNERGYQEALKDFFKPGGRFS